MNNRLKLLRKVMGKTQAEIAEIVGITQNAYSYWERGYVKIHNDSLIRLADFYGVSIDFIIGKPFSVSIPPEKWNENLRKQYEDADENMRLYMEYKYGNDKNSALPEGALVAGHVISSNSILYRRDGKLQKRELSDAQMKLFLAMLDIDGDK